MGKVAKYIGEKLERQGAILSVLIDPCDYASGDAAVETATSVWEAGADILVIGGSIGAQGELLDEVAKGVREKISIPVVLFPGNIATLTKYADALYFMSMLNSRNPYWISQAQTLAAPIVKRMKLEPLPVGYIVVEPGGTVGWVGDANLVPRRKPQIAAALALAGEFSGCRYILTDVGSASHLGPVPVEMVKAVAGAISVPYIVAGGIRTTAQARAILAAGADWVQIGTVVETGDAKRTIAGYAKVVREEGRKKA